MTRIDAAEAIRRRRATMAARGRSVVPRPLPPDSVQREYLRELRAMMQALARMVREEIDALPTPRADAPVDGTFGDPLPDDSALRRALLRAAARWFRRFPMRDLERLGRRIGEATSEHQRRQWTRQVRAAIGVDPTLSEPWLLPEIESFGRENANLITKMAQETIDKIQTHVTAATLAGDRHETLAKVLQERLQVSESRAKLIARDQVLSFTSDLAATRQQAAGVTEYIWRTVNDNRVRSTHEARAGQRFRWDTPPPGGHPGTEVLCRCYAEPIIDLTFGLGGPQPGSTPPVLNR